MIVHDSIDIDAPVERVWEIFTDVERWPEWTASVTALTILSGGGVAVGAKVRIKQPRFPRLVWEVTEVRPGTAWTWVTRSLGTVTAATHELHRLDGGGTRVEQIIEQHGLLGALIGRLTRGVTRRYLAMEAAGLRGRVEASLASTS